MSYYMYEDYQSDIGYGDALWRWLQGVEDELYFWNNYFFHHLDRISKMNKRFIFEEYLPSNEESTVKFLDVGSGPIGACGFYTDKVKKLEMIAIDPLAAAYKMLRRKYGIDNGLNLHSGFVELLSECFPSNHFDIVHMRNSLDHSFDPIYGIMQILQVLKIGGKLILRHHENEAQREHYMGFHQWNLSIDSKNHKFLIWNADHWYDVERIVAPYADMELSAKAEQGVDENGDAWVLNKVVLQKKKDIPANANPYIEKFHSIVYEYMLTMLVKNVFLNRTTDRRKICLELLDECLNRFENYMSKSDNMHQRIVIYGLGEIGQKLVDLCLICKMDIVAIIDRNRTAYKSFFAVSPDNYDYRVDVDWVIVTPLYDFGEIATKLHSKGVPIKKIIQVERYLETVI